MNALTVPQLIIVWALPVLFAVTVHEVAHGWVANKCGDRTALMLGRLTLNPLKHIDPIGTIIVPAILLFLGGFIFGWAKPVPVDWRNLKKPRRDMAFVAIAGPCTNLIMAILWAFIAKASIILAQNIDLREPSLIFQMGQAGININLMLMTLNLIPIPPLDGSRVVASLLPQSTAYLYNRLEPYGFFILMGLLAVGALSYLIMPVVLFFKTYMQSLLGI